MPEPSSEAAQVLGDRIRLERNRSARSQEDIAHLAGMNVSNYGKIERGQGNPTFETVIRIAAVLEVDPSKLVKEITGAMIPALPPTFTAREFARERRDRLGGS